VVRLFMEKKMGKIEDFMSLAKDLYKTIENSFKR
jgi:hypothetical protein